MGLYGTDFWLIAYKVYFYFRIGLLCNIICIKPDFFANKSVFSF